MGVREIEAAERQVAIMCTTIVEGGLTLDSNRLSATKPENFVGSIRWKGVFVVRLPFATLSLLSLVGAPVGAGEADADAAADVEAEATADAEVEVAAEVEAVAGTDVAADAASSFAFLAAGFFDFLVSASESESDESDEDSEEEDDEEEEDEEEALLRLPMVFAGVVD